MQSVRFIHSLALLCTHTVSVRWWLYNHVGILRQDLSPNNVVYWIIKEMKEAKATNAGTHGTLTDYNLLSWTASLGPRCRVRVFEGGKSDELPHRWFA